jgi:hypothetical protein
MFRRYNRWWSRFDQPDPYDGSYVADNPQSFNRYAYVNNDPVNFTDPTGLFANCGQPGLPKCEEEPRDPTDDLPRRPDDIPIILPVLPPPDRFGPGPVLPPKPRKLDPNSRECQDLARKIGNIIRDIAEAEEALKKDKHKLPLTGGEKARQSVEGHKKLKKQYEDNLLRRRKQYEEKCGGGDGPGGSPATEPAGNPTGNPASNPAGNDPKLIPVIPIIPVAPVPRPVTPSVPGGWPLPVIIIKCAVLKLCQGGTIQT